jgi:hypothetical protein
MKRNLAQGVLRNAIHSVLEGEERMKGFHSCRHEDICEVCFECQEDLRSKKIFLRDLVQWFFSEN